MRPLTRALGFLSVLPFGKLANFERGHLPAMLAAFPLAGAILGALLGAFWHVLLQVMDARPAAAVCVCAWAAMTRAFHLDGLADCADGLGGSYSPAGRLKIMKDPHIGVFGTAALFGAMLIKYSALESLAMGIRAPLIFLGTDLGLAGRRMLLLALIFSASRLGLLCGACQAKYARAEGGLGKEFIDAVKPGVLLIGAVVPLALVFAWGFELGLCVLFAPLLVALLLRLLFGRALGGQTGDTLGATVELGEMAALLAVCLRK